MPIPAMYFHQSHQDERASLEQGKLARGERDEGRGVLQHLHAEVHSADQPTNHGYLHPNVNLHTPRMKGKIVVINDQVVVINREVWIKVQVCQITLKKEVSIRGQKSARLPGKRMPG